MGGTGAAGTTRRFGSRRRRWRSSCRRTAWRHGCSARPPGSRCCTSRSGSRSRGCGPARTQARGAGAGGRARLRGARRARAQGDRLRLRAERVQRRAARAVRGHRGVLRASAAWRSPRSCTTSTAPARTTGPSLAWALEQLAAQKAEVLVVARLRDLSSNVANLAPLLRWFDSERRTLIALDLELDTSTEAGRLAAVRDRRRRRLGARADLRAHPPRARGRALARRRARDAPRSPTSPSCRSGSRACARRA